MDQKFNPEKHDAAHMVMCAKPSPPHLSSSPSLPLDHTRPKVMREVSVKGGASDILLVIVLGKDRIKKAEPAGFVEKLSTQWGLAKCWQMLTSTLRWDMAVPLPLQQEHLLQSSQWKGLERVGILPSC